MKIVYASSGAALGEIKALGFDTVVGTFTSIELDWMDANALACIWHATGTILPKHPAIIAYYVFDEPDDNKVSLQEQEARIRECRRQTTKPLAIACVEQTKALCSKNFDWYMMDIYYQTELGTFGRAINYLNAAISPHILRAIYRGKRIIPIMGLYDDTTRFRFNSETVPFARYFRKQFRTEDQAIFFWQGDGQTSWGVKDRPTYGYYAVEFNTSDMERIGWLRDRIMLGLGIVIASAREAIPDSLVGWINNRLPASWRMNI